MNRNILKKVFRTIGDNNVEVTVNMKGLKVDIVSLATQQDIRKALKEQPSILNNKHHLFTI